MKISLPNPFLLFAIFSYCLHIPTASAATEITRCCAGGSRHFRETQTCIGVKAVGTSSICARTASICCLRALLDGSCSAGTEHARQKGVCGTEVEGLGGVINKECCECCALAQELINRGEPCVAANGFSSACLSSFNKCCSNQSSQVQPSGGRNNWFESNQQSSNSCQDCEHLCSRTSDGSNECSCRAGYGLGSDGHSCVDVDECLLLIDNCLESQRCLNLPGSFKCIRTLSCGTGYAMDSETELCTDIDECNLGSHDCSPEYQCRNTQGSYRCDSRKCGPSEIVNPTTGECTSMDCPQGYVSEANGKCEDLDECLNTQRCSFFEDCINIPGSYRCQEKGNICSNGYQTDKDTGFCADKNECEDGTHTCGSLQCINLPGSFKCRCPAGFEFNETSKRCEDVNECIKFSGATCSSHANCENTVGSFKCHCRAGFQLAADSRNCDDVDECAAGLATCQQKCVNVPGSYQCLCERGYQLGIDEVTCEDIDECSTWAKSGHQLCMGSCVNNLGSYKCSCPAGYDLQEDGITCKDVDECASPGICQDPKQQICVNTLGGFKCQTLECPRNFVPDRHYKNRCVRKTHFCENLTFERCKAFPMHISWQHIAIPKQVNISSQRTSVILFSMKGPTNLTSTMQFELRHVHSKPEASNVVSATRGNFLLQKGDEHNSAVIALRDSLDGPQEVQLELILRLTNSGLFVGKYVANLLIYVSQYKPQSFHKHAFLHSHKSNNHLLL